MTSLKFEEVKGVLEEPNLNYIIVMASCVLRSAKSSLAEFIHGLELTPPIWVNSY